MDLPMLVHIDEVQVLTSLYFLTAAMMLFHTGIHQGTILGYRKHVIGDTSLCFILIVDIALYLFGGRSVLPRA
jgi:hypothetical protein